MTKHSTAPLVTFLVVDDDEVAIMAMKRAIRKLGLTNPVEIASNGEEALEKLRDGSESRIEKPYIVTLDLNMPRMTGLEFLAEVRADQRLKDAVIFVVSTSDAPTDVVAAYSRNIAGYIVKENTFDTLRRAVAMLRDFSEIVRLPLSADSGKAELRLAQPAT